MGSDREAEKKVVRDFMAAITAGDIEATKALMTDDATWWVSGSFPLSGTYDRDAFATMLSEVGEACTTPLQVTPKLLIAEDGNVALEAAVRVQTRDGRVYDNANFYLCVVRDGKVAEIREYMDTMHTNETFCQVA